MNGTISLLLGLVLGSAPPQPLAIDTQDERCGVSLSDWREAAALDETAGELVATSYADALREYKRAFDKALVPDYGAKRAKLEQKLNNYDLAILAADRALALDAKYARNGRCGSLLLDPDDRASLPKLAKQAGREMTLVHVQPDDNSALELCVAGHHLVQLESTKDRYIALESSRDDRIIETRGRQCIAVSRPVQVYFVRGEHCLDIRRDVPTASAVDADEVFEVVETRFVEPCEVLAFGAKRLISSHECPFVKPEVHPGRRVLIDLPGPETRKRGGPTAGPKAGTTGWEPLRSDSSCRRMNSRGSDNGVSEVKIAGVADPTQDLTLRLRPRRHAFSRETVSSSDLEQRPVHVEYSGWKWQTKTWVSVVVIAGAGVILGFSIDALLDLEKEGTIRFGP